MQPTGENLGAGGERRAGRNLLPHRFAIAATAALVAAGLTVTVAGADPLSSGPINTGASNGGVASASSGGNVNIGEIVTGENTGNSIVTGDIYGAADIAGGDIDYPTDVNVTLNVGPPIASADGGDGGQATAPSPEGPEYDVNIDNTDRTNNRSDATAVGEGGEGGEGGSGGDVIIGGEPVQ